MFSATTYYYLSQRELVQVPRNIYYTRIRQKAAWYLIYVLCIIIIYYYIKSEIDITPRDVTQYKLLVTNFLWFHAQRESFHTEEPVGRPRESKTDYSGAPLFGT